MSAEEIKDITEDYVYDVSKTHIKNGNRHFNNAEYFEAIVEYNVAIRLNPTNPNIHYNKGVALMKLGRHDEAVGCFDKVVKLSPNYFEDFNRRVCLT